MLDGEKLVSSVRAPAAEHTCKWTLHGRIGLLNATPPPHLLGSVAGSQAYQYYEEQKVIGHHFRCILQLRDIIRKIWPASRFFIPSTALGNCQLAFLVRWATGTPWHAGGSGEGLRHRN